jgi:hypothetical protein
MNWPTDTERNRMSTHKQKNNRWCPRQSVQLDVTLHACGQYPFNGKILNVSLGGLFVETDTMRLSGYTDVFIAFTLHTNSGTVIHRAPARRLRQHDNGVALQFTAPDPRVIHDLRQLIYPAPSLRHTASSHDTSRRRRPTG